MYILIGGVLASQSQENLFELGFVDITRQDQTASWGCEQINGSEGGFIDIDFKSLHGSHRHFPPHTYIVS